MVLRASFADRAFAALEGPGQPLDCALILHFPAAATPTVEALQRGAQTAMQRFPKSQCALRGAGWTPAPDAKLRLAEERFSDAVQAHHAARALLCRPFHVAAELSVEQALLVHPEGATLVFRMHHALGDLVSAVGWLSTQLNAEASSVPERELLLQKSAASVRRSRFAFSGPAARLAAPAHQASGKRAWRTIVFSKPRRARTDHWTYNDWLAAIALETAFQWNRAAQTSTEVGLWIPVNVRRAPFTGFGNGSSRIRVYRLPEQFHSFERAAASLREQVKWSRAHGEWHVPKAAERIASLGPAASWLARWLAGRPRVDMGTLLFSHAERLEPATEDDAALFSGATRLEIVAQLHAAHPMAILAATFRGKTSLTFTWDSGLFPEAAAENFVALFERVKSAAFTELGDG